MEWQNVLLVQKLFQMEEGKRMANVFISYSRKDLQVARQLTEAFKGQDLDFWIDWEGIPPTVDWWREIESGIEKADVFLFLISPDSCKSKVCKQEIEHAIKNGKRLIPVVVREIKDDEKPEGLSHLNWIFFREGDEFDPDFNKLMTAIKTDYEWVQTHRELLVKALEWERSNHEDSLLLHGKELRDAEFQLAIRVLVHVKRVNDSQMAIADRQKHIHAKVARCLIERPKKMRMHHLKQDRSLGNAACARRIRRLAGM